MTTRNVWTPTGKIAVKAGKKMRLPENVPKVTCSLMAGRLWLASIRMYLQQLVSGGSAGCASQAVFENAIFQILKPKWPVG